MAQTRPYREGMTAQQIKVFLLDLSSKGKLDPNVVEVALANLPAAMQAAGAQTA